MPIPSLYISRDGARAWNVARAAAYGAGIGALAALFKTFGPSHASGSAAADILQIAGGALAFALLCAGAAALRNSMARRFIWPEMTQRTLD
jgi:hypothetical protein